MKPEPVNKEKPLDPRLFWGSEGEATFFGQFFNVIDPPVVCEGKHKGMSTINGYMVCIACGEYDE